MVNKFVGRVRRLFALLDLICGRALLHSQIDYRRRRQGREIPCSCPAYFWLKVAKASPPG